MRGRRRPAHIKPVPRQQHCTSKDQVLDGLLIWLDAISAEVERYVRPDADEAGMSADDGATNENARGWINTCLEDIAATLVGISLHQTPKNR